MSLSKSREESVEVIERLRKHKVSMAIFCTASHWNTEAILKAADDFARDHGIKDIPVAIAITCNYRHMSQAKRVTYSQSTQTGFLSIMDHIKRLCDDQYAPYKNVKVLTHLDHADPEYDSWALNEGIEYLSSVMFDAQRYPAAQNMEMTREYVKKYSDRILIEGIMDELSVLGKIQQHSGDDYAPRALEYVEKTGIDFLVADLGTEQQSTGVGKSRFLKQRALDLTKALGRSMLVLHGTSCLDDAQIADLPECGIIRVNMWTRIAREAGEYAAQRLMERADKIRQGDFEAVESRAYVIDSIEKASQIMYDALGLLQYRRLAQ